MARKKMSYCRITVARAKAIVSKFRSAKKKAARLARLGNTARAKA
jgi:hypothetical protein